MTSLSDADSPRGRKHAWAVGAIAALLTLLCSARVTNSDLFVAGDGFSLEDALTDARTQRTDTDPPHYRVLVLGPEVKRLIRRGVSQRLIQRIRAATKSGAVFYVCQKDLTSLGLRTADLLPGVQAVRGFPATQSGIGEESALQQSTGSDRRIMSICSG